MNAPPSQPEKCRGLIVDDERDIRDLVSQLFELEGLTPLTACDGKSALQQLRSSVPDVLILDLQLPDLNGMEILRQVKLMDPDLPVVILTADARGAVEAICPDAFECLAKPFDNLELIQVIRRAVAERRVKLQLRRFSGQINPQRELGLSMGPSEAIHRLIADRLSLREIVAQSTAALERGVLLQILRQTGGNKAKAARLLHIDYKTMQSKIQKYGISKNSEEQ